MKFKNYFYITFVISIGLCFTFVNSNGQNAPTLGLAKNYALLSGGSIISTDTASSSGKAGAVDSIINIIASNGVFENNSGDVTDAIADANAFIIACDSLHFTSINTLNGSALNAGYYSITGNDYLHDTLTLNGDSSSVFIFKISGSLDIDFGAIILYNRIKTNNIYWIVNSNTNIENNSQIIGSVLCSGTINLHQYNSAYLSLYSSENINIIIPNWTSFLNNGFFSNYEQQKLNLPIPLACNFLFNCNEIPNSDFGYFSSIPDFEGQIDRACPWIIPAPSPDYFSSNYFNQPNLPYIGVPDNIGGHRVDHSIGAASQAYACVWAPKGMPFPTNAYEYIQTQLYHQLDNNRTYYGEFFVAIANESRKFIKKMGMAITSSQPTQNPPGIPLTTIPQIESNFDLNVNGWQRVSNTFVASNNMQFVTIGNFKSLNTWNNSSYNSAGILQGAYYNIDDPLIVPFEVDAGEPQTVCSAPTTIQLGAYTCMNSVEGVSYDWVLLPGSPILSGVFLNNPHAYNASLTVNILPSTPVTQVYEVTLTAPNGTKTTDQVTITIGLTNDECVCHVYNNDLPTLPDNVFEYTLPAGNYDVKHDVTLPYGVTYLHFIDSKFAMASGVQITVPYDNGSNGRYTKYVYITFENCHFYGCSDMWKGIFFEDHAEAFFHNCKFEDADIALNFGANSHSMIKNCEFTNNVVGILNRQPIGTVSYMDIMGNTFKGTGVFKSYYLDQPPHGKFPKAGMILNCLIPALNSTVSGPSYFSRLNTGMQLWHCEAVIENYKFDDINNEHFYPEDYMGSAIYLRSSISINNRVDVKPFIGQFATNPTFRNCHIGVYTRTINATISDCRMLDVDTGIYATRTGLHRAVICSTNTIYARHFGIIFENNPHAGDLIARENVVHTTQTNGCCISAIEFSKVQDRFNADRNHELTNEQGGVGISLDNINTAKVTDNTLNCPTQSNYRGILVDNCINSTITCNQVTGPGISNHTFGLDLNSSENSRLTCNIFAMTRFGIDCRGNSNNSTLKGNTFLNHYNGLRLEMGAKIGVQDHFDNVFQGTFTSPSGMGAFFVGNPTPALILYSKFYVNGAYASFDHPANNLGSTWFDIVIGPSQFQGCGGACHPITHPNDDMITPFDIAVALGNFNPDEFPEETESMARHSLYEKLLRNEELISSSDTIQNFYNTYEETAVQMQAELLQNINSLALYTEEYQTLFDGVDSALSSVNDSLLALQNYQQDSAILYATNVLNAQSSNLMIAKNNLIEQLQALLNNQLNNLIVQNSIIEPKTLCEENEQIVNDIYLHTIDREEIIFTDLQKSALLNIAHQCPYYGGNAVFCARAMYKIVDPQIQYDDDAACLAQGLYRLSSNHNEDQIPSIIMTLKPNPTSEETTIYYAIPKNYGECYISIFDLMNRPVNKIKLPLNENTLVLNTQNLNSGTFIIKLICKNELVAKNKLIIVR